MGLVHRAGGASFARLLAAHSLFPLTWEGGFLPGNTILFPPSSSGNLFLLLSSPTFGNRHRNAPSVSPSAHRASCRSADTPVRASWSPSCAPSSSGSRRRALELWPASLRRAASLPSMSALPCTCASSAHLHPPGPAPPLRFHGHLSLWPHGASHPPGSSSSVTTSGGTSPLPGTVQNLHPYPELCAPWPHSCTCLFFTQRTLHRPNHPDGGSTLLGRVL